MFITACRVHTVMSNTRSSSVFKNNAEDSFLVCMDGYPASLDPSAAPCKCTASGEQAVASLSVSLLDTERFPITSPQRFSISRPHTALKYSLNDSFDA